MDNVMPVELLGIGVLGLIMGIGFGPVLRYYHQSAYGRLRNATDQKSDSTERVRAAVEAYGSIMLPFQKVVLGLFRLACGIIGGVAILAYLIGFCGVDIFELVFLPK